MRGDAKWSSIVAANDKLFCCPASASSVLVIDAPTPAAAPPLQPPQQPALPQIAAGAIRFDDPRRRLGEGAFGVVYRSAEGGWQGVTVAVKELRTDDAHSGARHAAPSSKRPLPVICTTVPPLSGSLLGLSAWISAFSWYV